VHRHGAVDVRPSLDLHAGGADLRFPHHAYESAQAEAATGVSPFARSWLHIGTVRLDGEKMAKSTGNLVFVRDLLAATEGAVVRALLLDRPYALPWDHTDAELERAGTRLDALRSAAGRRRSTPAAGPSWSASSTTSTCRLPGTSRWRRAVRPPAS
jgi:cysteinyl-tRNA synthetase